MPVSASVNLSADDITGSTFSVLEGGKERSGTVKKAEERNGGSKIICFTDQGPTFKIARDETDSWRSLGADISLSLVSGKRIVCCQSASS